MKYIDADKLIATLERQNVDKKVIEPLIRIINSLQQEQPNKNMVEADAKVCKLLGRAWITPIDEKKFVQNVYDNFGPDDRVRIIIVKEGEK